MTQTNLKLYLITYTLMYGNTAAYNQKKYTKAHSIKQAIINFKYSSISQYNRSRDITITEIPPQQSESKDKKNNPTQVRGEQLSFL